MVITAGTRERALRSSGDWAFLDVGFSQKSRSCGLAMPDEKPECITFGDARKRLCRYVAASRVPINLVIEAPLSVAFSAMGNPTGRRMEFLGTKRRYWYTGAGPAVMLAALYLIRDLDAAANRSARIFLFEGFVSFKKAPSDHLADVRALMDVVANSKAHTRSILAREDIKAELTDQVESAGRVCGIDFGVPAVLVASTLP